MLDANTHAKKCNKCPSITICILSPIYGILDIDYKFPTKVFVFFTAFKKYFFAKRYSHTAS